MTKASDITDRSNVDVYPEVSSALRNLRKMGWLSVIVTNQPAVAKGKCTLEELERIHGRLEGILGRGAAYFDGIYYCPHHPHRGYSGENSQLKIECTCRKPRPGMIEAAQRELNIDLTRSWIIGDSTCDILVGQNVGLRNVLVRTGVAGRDVKFRVRPDFEMDTLADAVLFASEKFEIAKAQVACWYREHAESFAPHWIIVGGHPFSGKSLFAGVLKVLLTEQGFDAQVIPSDSFLLAGSSCRINALVGQFDLKKLESFLSNLQASSRASPVFLSRYDRIRGIQLEDAMEYARSPKSVWIVEGPCGFASDALRTVDSVRVFITSDESSRLERLRRSYAFRGHDSSRIKAVIEEGLSTEWPMIEQQRLLVGSTFEFVSLQ